MSIEKVARLVTCAILGHVIGDGFTYHDVWSIFWASLAVFAAIILIFFDEDF